MSEHAILSASGATRWFECPGSLWISKDIPSGTSEYAEWGTVAHEYAGRALEASLSGVSPSKVYREIEEAEMEKMVRGYVNFCVKCYFDLTKVSDTKPKWYVEHKVKFSEHVWGTADFIITFEVGGLDYMVVIDLKTGAGVPVSVASSDQIRVYAVAAAKTMGIRPHQTCLYIYQPRVYDEPQKAVVPGEELAEFEGKMAAKEQTALHVIQNGAERHHFKAGSHCKFCPAWSICPEFKNAAKDIATKDLDEISSDANLPTPNRLSTEQIVKVFKNKSLIEDWLKACEHYVLTELGKGKKISGLKLVKGRSSRRWIEDRKKVEKGLKRLGIKDPWNKKLIGIGDAEKLTKKDFSHLVTMSEPKLQVTVEEDLRPGIGNAFREKALDYLTEIEDVKRTNKSGGAGKAPRDKKKKVRGR